MTETVDGYVVMAINKDGHEFIIEGPRWFDIRLESVCFDDAEGGGQLVDGLPKEMRNVQVLIAYKYKSVGGKGFEGEWDFEEVFEVVSHTLINDDYKEFSRRNISEKVKILLVNAGLDNFYEKLQEEAKLAESQSGELDDYEVFGHSIMRRTDLANQLIAEIEEWMEFHDEEFELTVDKPKPIFTF